MSAATESEAAAAATLADAHLAIAQERRRRRVIPVIFAFVLAFSLIAAALSLVALYRDRHGQQQQQPLPDSGNAARSAAPAPPLDQQKESAVSAIDIEVTPGPGIPIPLLEPEMMSCIAGIAMVPRDELATHNRGVWSADQEYAVGDLVTHRNWLYKCRRDNLGLPPGDTDNNKIWDDRLTYVAALCRDECMLLTYNNDDPTWCGAFFEKSHTYEVGDVVFQFMTRRHYRATRRTMGGEFPALAAPPADVWEEVPRSVLKAEAGLAVSPGDDEAAIDDSKAFAMWSLMFMISEMQAERKAAAPQPAVEADA